LCNEENGANTKLNLERKFVYVGITAKIKIAAPILIVPPILSGHARKIA